MQQQSKRQIKRQEISERDPSTPWKHHDWAQVRKHQDPQDHLQQHLDNDTSQVEDTAAHVHSPSKFRIDRDTPGDMHWQEGEGDRTLDLRNKW